MESFSKYYFLKLCLFIIHCPYFSKVTLSLKKVKKLFSLIFSEFPIHFPAYQLNTILLYFQVLDEHRAVSLVLQLAVEHSKTGTAVTAGSRIIQILCELGQVEQASACLEKHQTWITGFSTDYTLNILFLVAKAQLFLLSKKVRTPR